MPSIDLDLALEDRDPETLLGPLLSLLTRLAHRQFDSCEAGELLAALVAHCSALAAHPALPPRLRIAIGGIAIEQRKRAFAYA